MVTFLQLQKTDAQVWAKFNVTSVIARAFEKVVFNAHARDVVEENLTASQFAYREGGSCTDALIAIQHAVNQYLDDPQCTAVRLYAMDFSFRLCKT